MLLALNIGGDDYVCKPYSLGVLLAKVKAILKRYENAQTSPSDASEGTGGKENEAAKTSGKDLGEVVRFGDVTVDLKSGMVRRGESEERLKTMEYKLLSYLLKNRNRIISKDEFFEKVWETPYVGDVTLNVHVRHLREKIEENPKEPKYLKTVWGVGFILEYKES